MAEGEIKLQDNGNANEKKDEKKEPVHRSWLIAIIQDGVFLLNGFFCYLFIVELPYTCFSKSEMEVFGWVFLGLAGVLKLCYKTSYSGSKQIELLVQDTIMGIIFLNIPFLVMQIIMSGYRTNLDIIDTSLIVNMIALTVDVIVLQYLVRKNNLCDIKDGYPTFGPTKKASLSCKNLQPFLYAVFMFCSIVILIANSPNGDSLHYCGEVSFTSSGVNDTAYFGIQFGWRDNQDIIDEQQSQIIDILGGASPLTQNITSDLDPNGKSMVVLNWETFDVEIGTYDEYTVCSLIRVSNDSVKNKFAAQISASVEAEVREDVCSGYATIYTGEKDDQYFVLEADMLIVGDGYSDTCEEDAKRYTCENVKGTSNSLKITNIRLYEAGTQLWKKYW